MIEIDEDAISEDDWAAAMAEVAQNEAEKNFSHGPADMLSSNEVDALLKGVCGDDDDDTPPEVSIPFTQDEIEILIKALNPLPVGEVFSLYQKILNNKVS